MTTYETRCQFIFAGKDKDLTGKIVKVKNISTVINAGVLGPDGLQLTSGENGSVNYIVDYKAELDGVGGSHIITVSEFTAGDKRPYPEGTYLKVNRTVFTKQTVTGGDLNIFNSHAAFIHTDIDFDNTEGKRGKDVLQLLLTDRRFSGSYDGISLEKVEATITPIEGRPDFCMITIDRSALLMESGEPRSLIPHRMLNHLTVNGDYDLKQSPHRADITFILKNDKIRLGTDGEKLEVGHEVDCTLSVSLICFGDNGKIYIPDQTLAAVHSLHP